MNFFIVFLGFFSFFHESLVLNGLRRVVIVKISFQSERKCFFYMYGEGGGERGKGMIFNRCNFPLSFGIAE